MQQKKDRRLRRLALQKSLRQNREEKGVLPATHRMHPPSRSFLVNFNFSRKLFGSFLIVLGIILFSVSGSHINKIFAQSQTPARSKIDISIKGAEKVLWDSSSKYELIFKQDGQTKKWFPVVRWKILENDGINIELDDNRESINQIVRTPPGEAKFDETAFILLAETNIDLPNGETFKGITRKRILVTNRSEECKELNNTIRSRENNIKILEDEILELKKQKESIQIPKPIGDEAGQKIIKELSLKKAELTDTEKAVEKAENFIRNLNKTKNNLDQIRRTLWRNVSPAARIIFASDRYNKSAKSDQDKLDFIWGVLGRGAGTPKTIRDPSLDLSVDQAKEVVKNTIVPRVGFGLTQIGGLMALGPSPDLSDFQLFAVGLYIDSKIDSSSFMTDAKLLTSDLKTVYKYNQKISRLGRKLQRLKKTGTDRNVIEAAESELHRAIISAHDKSIDSINAINRLIPRSQKLLRENKNRFEKLSREINTLETKIRNLSQKQEERLYEILDAQNQKNDIQFKIDTLSEKLSDQRAYLSEVKNQLSEFCDDEFEPLEISEQISSTGKTQLKILVYDAVGKLRNTHINIYRNDKKVKGSWTEYSPFDLPPGVFEIHLGYALGIKRSVEIKRGKVSTLTLRNVAGRLETSFYDGTGKLKNKHINIFRDGEKVKGAWTNRGPFDLPPGVYEIRYSLGDEPVKKSVVIRTGEVSHIKL